MTLFVVVSMPEQTIVCTDRRITGHERFKTEDANKGLALTTTDARVAVSMAGLSHCEDFDTLQWLVSSLVKLAGQYQTLSPITDELTAMLTETIGNLPCERKALEVVFSGYMYRPDGTYMPGLRIISNYHDAQIRSGPIQDTFTGVDLVAADWKPIVYAGGHVADALAPRLQGLCDHAARCDAEGIDFGTVVRHCRQMIQAYAASPESKGRVGGAVSTLILPKLPADVPTLQFHDAESDGRVIGFRGPAAIAVRPGQPPLVMPSMSMEIPFHAVERIS